MDAQRISYEPTHSPGLSVNDDWFLDESNPSFKTVWQRVEPTNKPQIIDFEVGGFQTIYESGFPTAVFRCINAVQDYAVKGLAEKRDTISERLLIVSNDSKSPSGSKHKPKKTNNRKKKLFATHFQYEGVWYELVERSDEHGIYPHILDRIIQQLNIAISIHKRIFVLRFDLRQKDNYTEDSKMISAFFDRIKKRLKAHYSGLHSIGYIWAREQEKAKAQHYHCALILDNDLVNNAYITGKLIREVWESLDEVNSVHLVSKPHTVRNTFSMGVVVQHLSYLAKIRGKGYRPPQSKDSNASRLKLTNL
jgi:hypothetical protein